MKQVPRRVAIVALFLLIFFQPAFFESQSEESHEIGQIEHDIEESMNNMAENFEDGTGINGKQSRIINKAFPSSEDIKDFKIKPGGNAHIRLAYQLPKGKGSSTFTGKKKKGPEYYLNFVFNNYRNPAKPLDRKTLSKKIKMRRTGSRFLPNGMPNPYKYFPLKGEDM
ncbi:uncharacterized protein [Drosophila takahashii]|uniref:uncharacterized protein n=1 Tax=Drosophila takahashii TaxID=29030 RepID=UPI00389949A4